MRAPPLVSLSVKVGLVLFAVVAGALAIVYIAVVPQLENRLVDAKIDELGKAAPEVGQQVRDLEFFSMQQVVRDQSESVGSRIVVLEALTDDQLRKVADSRDSPLGDFSTDPLALEARATQRLASGRSEHEGEQYAEVAQPEGRLVVVLAAPLEDVLANVRLVRRSLLVAGAVSLVISWLVGYLLAWSFTRRIRRLEAAAERLADGDYDTPVVDGGRDEVGQLADAFDSMRVRLSVLGGLVRGLTHNGGLTVLLSGQRWEGEGIDVETTNGGVTLSIPDGYNAQLETRTSNGGFRTEYPITVQGELSQRRGISATLGSGGAPVRIRTTNGGFRINRR